MITVYISDGTIWQLKADAPVRKAGAVRSNGLRVRDGGASIWYMPHMIERIEFETPDEAFERARKTVRVSGG